VSKDYDAELEKSRRQGDSLISLISLFAFVPIGMQAGSTNAPVIDGRSALALISAMDYLKAEHKEVYRDLVLENFNIKFHYKAVNIDLEFSPATPLEERGGMFKRGTDNPAIDGFLIKVDKKSNKALGLFVSG
jgi:hypothetical protein